MKTNMLKNCCILLIFIFASCTPEKDVQNEMNIIPLPVQAEFRGGWFKISEKTRVTVPDDNPEVQKIVLTFAERLNDRGGLNLEVVVAESIKARDNEIRFVIDGDKDLFGDEGYSLDISQGKVLP